MSDQPPIWTDAVIDIETLDDKVTSVIFSIGIVPFNLATGEIATREQSFEVNISIASAIKHGFTIGLETMQWWLDGKKDVKALQNLTLAMGDYELDLPLELLPLALPDGIHRALTWLRDHASEDVRVWGKGPSFDNAIMAHAARQLNLYDELFWSPFREQCVRTMEHLSTMKGISLRDEVPFPHLGTPHVAYWDALWEARMVCKAAQILGVSN